MTNFPSVVPSASPQQQAAKDLIRQHGPDPRTEDESEFRAAWKRLAEAGVLTLLIPQHGLDAEAVLDTLEGLGEGTRDAGFLLALGAHCFAVGAGLTRFGGESRRELLDMLRDGSTVTAFAASEPDAGSDVMALRTRCVPVGDDYLLEGTKHFVTNAAVAGHFLVFATRDPRLNWRGLTAFVVPADTPGLSLGPQQHLAGFTGCSVGTVHLDSVTVPGSAVLGRPGQGSAVFRHALLWERALLPVMTVGTIRRQLAEMIQQAQDTSRGAARPVVDVLSRYLLGRLLVRDTVTKLAAGTLTSAQAGLTKLWISEAELAVSRELAGFDLTTGSGSVPAAVHGLLHALGGTIYSGTSDIQRKIVAAELGIVE